MYTAPVRGLRTVEGNRVICVRFRDPKYPSDFIFPSERLDGARDPPTVLKPGEYTGGDGGRGRGRGYNHGGHRGGQDYRPQMGFAPRRDQASLGGAGHRMLAHHTPSGVPPVPLGGAYSSVPPPLMMSQPEGGYPSQRGRGFGGYGGGRGGQQQQGGYNNYGQDRNRGGVGGGYQQQNQRGGYQNNRGGGGGGYQNNWNSGNQNQQRGGGGGGYQTNRGRGNRGGGGYYTSGYQQ